MAVELARVHRQICLHVASGEMDSCEEDLSFSLLPAELLEEGCWEEDASSDLDCTDLRVDPAVPLSVEQKGEAGNTPWTNLARFEEGGRPWSCSLATAEAKERAADAMEGWYPRHSPPSCSPDSANRELTRVDPTDPFCAAWSPLRMNKGTRNCNGTDLSPTSVLLSPLDSEDSKKCHVASARFSRPDALPWGRGCADSFRESSNATASDGGFHVARAAEEVKAVASPTVSIPAVAHSSPGGYSRRHQDRELRWQRNSRHGVHGTDNGGSALFVAVPAQKPVRVTESQDFHSSRRGHGGHEAAGPSHARHMSWPGGHEHGPAGRQHGGGTRTDMVSIDQSVLKRGRVAAGGGGSSHGGAGTGVFLPRTAAEVPVQLGKKGQRRSRVLLPSWLVATLGLNLDGNNNVILSRVPAVVPVMAVQRGAFLRQDLAA